MLVANELYYLYFRHTMQEQDAISLNKSASDGTGSFHLGHNTHEVCRLNYNEQSLISCFLRSRILLARVNQKPA